MIVYPNVRALEADTNVETSSGEILRAGVHEGAGTANRGRESVPVESLSAEQERIRTLGESGTLRSGNVGPETDQHHASSSSAHLEGILPRRFYAVARGRRVGIFTDWEIVQPLVDRFPNARHRAFRTREEAEIFLAREMARFRR